MTLRGVYGGENKSENFPKLREERARREGKLGNAQIERVFFFLGRCPPDTFDFRALNNDFVIPTPSRCHRRNFLTNLESAILKLMTAFDNERDSKDLICNF